MAKALVCLKKGPSICAELLLVSDRVAFGYDIWCMVWWGKRQKQFRFEAVVFVTELQSPHHFWPWFRIHPTNFSALSLSLSIKQSHALTLISYCWPIGSVWGRTYAYMASWGLAPHRRWLRWFVSSSKVIRCTTNKQWYMLHGSSSTTISGRLPFNPLHLVFCFCHLSLSLSLSVSLPFLPV